MSEDEVVERVAKALLTAFGEECGCRCAWEDCEQKSYRRIARAAITAMRDQASVSWSEPDDPYPAPCGWTVYGWVA